MFGIDDVLLASLIGGGAGAMFNRKDPLKGALMGAGLGAGGAALPGLLSGAGAAASAGGTATLGAEQLAAAKAQEAGLGQLGGIGWGGATTGVQGMANSSLGGATGLLGNMDKITRPASIAMQASQAVAPENKAPMIQPVPLSPHMANSNLGQIVQQNQQSEMQRRQLEEQRRQMRRQRIGMMGGY